MMSRRRSRSKSREDSSTKKYMNELSLPLSFSLFLLLPFSLSPFSLPLSLLFFLSPFFFHLFSLSLPPSLSVTKNKNEFRNRTSKAEDPSHSTKLGNHSSRNVAQSENSKKKLMPTHTWQRCRWKDAGKRVEERIEATRFDFFRRRFAKKGGRACLAM